MPTPLHLMPAFLAVLVSAGPALAQLPTAPAPHETLDDVVKEYLRLGLPLPPKDAELVRINWLAYTEMYDQVPENPCLLAFRVVPSVPADPRYFRFIVFCDLMEEPFVESYAVEVVKPTPEVLERAYDQTSSKLFSLAVAFKTRGWDELARACYQRARDQLAEEEAETSPLAELRHGAFIFWAGQRTEPKSDRKEILRRLKELIEEDDSLRSPENGFLLSALESTVKSVRSKPGTVEALIDDLTEYWVDSVEPWKRSGDQAYWKLVELGFDAVPALIEHLHDDRLTRSWSRGFSFRSAHGLTVGHLCSHILNELSGRSIGGGYWELRGDRHDAEEVLKWFESAKRMGEEKWLIAHAIPTDNGQTIVNQDGRPEPHIVRVLGAKYPGRLKEVYRAMLSKPDTFWHFWFGDFVDEILTGKLTRVQKIALLEEGAAHEKFEHRVYALEGLASLDPALFRKRLLQSFTEIESRRKTEMVWEVSPYDLFPLAERANDRACWDSVVRVAKGESLECNMILVRDLGLLEPPNKKDPIRKERIRGLLKFLDDAEAERNEDGTRMEVRDFAAASLASLLRLRVKRNLSFIAVPDGTRGYFGRLAYRETVRVLAERELVKPEK